MAGEIKPKRPVRGDAFAFPLWDGRFAVVRVLREARGAAAGDKDDRLLAATSAWLGDRVPDPADPALRPIFLRNHHAFQNDPSIVWILDESPWGDVPADFVPIGTIAPTPEEEATECAAFGDWSALTRQPLLQWRWEHDREAVLAEDRDRAQRTATGRAAAQQERQKYLATVTLADLRGRAFFPTWEGFVEVQALRDSRRVMSRAVAELMELGPDAEEADRLVVLRRCIEAFNALDDKYGFIYTIEREDICEEFEVVAAACGIPHPGELADEWREW